MANSIIQSINTIAKSLVDNAGYDKTRGGMVVGVNDVTNTYSVKIDGITYNNVKTVDDATYNLGDMVKVVIPCNQATQMYISSSIFSDNSLGNRIVNAMTLAGKAEQLGLDNVIEIGRVEDIAESKNKTFRQASEPTSGMSKGDIWIDTDDGNKMYIWDGTQWVFSSADGRTLYGTCNTAANTTTKSVVCSDATSLYVGLTITVKFSTANTVLAPTLNVNGLGAKNIWVENAITSTSNCLFWNTDALIVFTYDGTQWLVVDQPTSYYASCSTAEDTTAKVATVANSVVRKGTRVTITFTYAHNSTSNATLYITGTSTNANRTMYVNGAVVNNTNGNSWSSGESVTFVFNGQYWYAAIEPKGNVEISIDTISYPNQTATLKAILFVNGKVVAPISYQWSYGDTPTTISGATGQTLNITAASAGGLGLNAKYNCAVTW
jgi:hypothetical protein